MSNVSQWDTAAANNSDAPPDGWPESTQTIPTINDCAREMMAALARLLQDTNGSLVTGGAGNAYTLTTNNSGDTALGDLPVLVFRANRANTGAATLEVNGGGAKAMVIKGGQALESGAIQADQIVIAAPNADQDRYEIALVGAGVTASDLASSTMGFALTNGALAASVESNVLTVAVKTLAGADPSPADPVYALFRSATLANGTFVVRPIVAALSIDVPVGATAATENNTAFRFWLTVHDDNGTVRLGISNRRTSTGIAPIDEAGKSTTTAISAGADSAAVYYTTTAITTPAPLQVVGYLEYTSGLATAGTYNVAPQLVQLRTWATKLPGDEVQTQFAEYTDSTTLTANMALDASIPQNTEGTEVLSLPVSLQSPVNLVDARFDAFWGSGGNAAVAVAALFRDSDADAINATACRVELGGSAMPFPLSHAFFPDAASTTLKIRVGGVADNIALNGFSTNNPFFDGAARATLMVREIMG